MAATALTQFDEVIKRFGKVAGYALGGSTLVPLITAASGMAPDWPDGLPMIASIFMLVTLVLTFHFLSARRRSTFSWLLVIGTVGLVASIAGYSYERGQFVMTAPRTGATLTLGCKWRSEIVLLAVKQGIDTSDQCPGDFQELLAKHEDNPFNVWTIQSITNVYYRIATLWVMMFAMLALVLGSFVIYYTRRPTPPGSPRRPRSAPPPKAS